jgi:hypothetical protein
VSQRRRRKRERERERGRQGQTKRGRGGEGMGLDRQSVWRSFILFRREKSTSIEVMFMTADSLGMTPI